MDGVLRGINLPLLRKGVESLSTISRGMQRSMPSFYLSLFLQGDLKQKEKEAQREEDENFGDSWVGQTRTWLWKTMEYPWTSKLAQVNRGCSWVSWESPRNHLPSSALLSKLRKL